MKIKTISVQRTKNLGNYQSEKLEMFAELDENDNPEVEVIKLRDTVKKLLYSTLPETNSEKIEERVPF